jgi:hypothetical protein
MTRICPPEGEACYPLIPTEDDASVPTRPTTPAPTRVGVVGQIRQPGRGACTPPKATQASPPILPPPPPLRGGLWTTPSATVAPDEFISGLGAP